MDIIITKIGSSNPKEESVQTKKAKKIPLKSNTEISRIQKSIWKIHGTAKEARNYYAVDDIAKERQKTKLNGIIMQAVVGT